MGLTVHFQLTASTSVGKAGANKIVVAMHRIAMSFQREGFVDNVLPVAAEAEVLGQFARDWLILPVPGEENTSTDVEILPLAGFIFPVDVGKDCEPLWLGLCQYPQTVRFQGKELPTKNGPGWRLAGFSKTQFASLHGWGHFQRCHCAVVNLLAACRMPGVRIKILDEGDYWPRRSLVRLRENLDHLNGLVAATAGALKDSCETAEGSVKSPIFAHKNFERLEAEGATRVALALKELRKLVRKP